GGDGRRRGGFRSGPASLHLRRSAQHDADDNAECAAHAGIPRDGPATQRLREHRPGPRTPERARTPGAGPRDRGRRGPSRDPTKPLLMLFQSVSFFVFLGILIGLLAVVRHPRFRVGILVVAGWVFYGWWDVRFVPLLWGYTLIGWLAGLALGSRRLQAHRTAVLWCSVALSLLPLGFFKYAIFLSKEIAALIGAAPQALSIVLPVGISFITFEIISYVCDVHDGKLKPTRNLLDFALFNGFFPRIISGPIIRPAQFLPQIRIAPVLRRSGLPLRPAPLLPR